MQLSVFETLADPTRRAIVEALRGGEHAVNDIVARVDKIGRASCRERVFRVV